MAISFSATIFGGREDRRAWADGVQPDSATLEFEDPSPDEIAKRGLCRRKCPVQLAP
jgi:hypothetical protein